MRRLARAYQARLNFYVINRGELPDYEGTAPAVGRPVVGAVSALRAKQPMDFTFDAHSELSPEKLKEWIDLFLAGKLKKVRRGASCANAVLRTSHALRCRSARRAHRWRSCRTAPPCASTTRSGRYTSTTWPSGTRRSATWSSPCSKCVAGHNSLVVFALLSPARSRRQLEEALLLDPASPILHYNMGQVDPRPTHTHLTTHTPFPWRAAVIRTGLQAREMMGEMEGAIAEYKLSLDNDIRYMDGTRTRNRFVMAVSSTPCR